MKGRSIDGENGVATRRLGRERHETDARLGFPRLRRAAAMLAATFLAGAATGCTSTDDLRGQVRRLNSSVEQVQNEALFVNILRASEDAPLSFTQLTVIRGSGTLSGAVGALPTFDLGSRPVVTNILGGTGTATASTNTNFDLSVLESKEFWLGLQRPLTAETLDFLVREGLPRELLFSLFIQKITVGEQGRTVSLTNDPTAPDFGSFNRELQAALDFGLSTKTVPRVVPYGPPLSANSASNLKSLVEVAKAGLVMIPTKTANGPRYQMASVQPAALVCFDRSLALKSKGLASAKPACDAISQETPSLSQSTSSVGFTREGGAGGRADVTIYARSTLDIIHFLGSLVRAGTALPVGSATADDLFVVERNAPLSDDFVSATYRGTRYSIPGRATSTIRVFTLLRRLVALSTSVNALPAPNTLTTIVN